MGFYIRLCKVDKTKLIETRFSRDERECYDSERFRSESFKSGKYVGDREFAGHLSTNSVMVYLTQGYALRPVDFDKAEQWIKENIEAEGNQERLLNALKLILEDENIYFEYDF